MADVAVGVEPRPFLTEDRARGDHTVASLASACIARYDADEDGVLDRAEIQRLLADLLDDDDASAGRKAARLSDAQLDTIWALLTGGRSDSGGVSAADLAAVWPAWIAPILRPCTALIIVDVQNDFIDGTLGLKFCPAGQDGAAVVPRINRLREAVGAAFALVVTTADAHPADHCSFIDNVAKQRLHPSSPLTAVDAKVFDTVLLDYNGRAIPQKLWPAHCVQGTWGEEFHADLVRRPTDVLLRKGTRADVDSYSAFWDNARLAATGLHDTLRAAGVTDVVVCGLAFDVCVHATVMDAVELGYRTILVEEACAGVTAEGIASARTAMQAAGVLLMPADAVPSLTEGTHRPATLAVAHAAFLAKKQPA